MLYAVHTPSQPLCQFVEQLWALRDQPAHATERIVPSGTLELVINLSEDVIRVHDRERAQWRDYPGAVVSGAYRRYFEIDTRAHASIIGVHFRPGAAGPVLGVPPGLLGDAHVALESLWGRSAKQLRERLSAATTNEERFALLEHELCGRLDDARWPHPAVPFALGRLATGAASVGDLAADLGLSHRRLIEVFTADVGITPKRLGRVLRFQRTVAHARRARSLDWSALASACGYFDQAHLIRDCRELTGMTPRAFVAASERVKSDHAAVGSNSSNR